MPLGLRYRLSFLLAAGGIGLCGYGSLQWHQLPHYSEDDLRASTELNLQLDLVLQGVNPSSVSGQLDQLRRQVRTEVESNIRADRERAISWLAIGAALLAMFASRVLLGRPYPRH